MHYQELKIITKTYDLYLNFYLEIKSWPKPERYNLGSRCENIILDILENLISASKIRKKLKILQKCNIKIALLSKMIRLGKDIKIITPRKYIFLETKILEIGRMLGGWIKSI